MSETAVQAKFELSEEQERKALELLRQITANPVAIDATEANGGLVVKKISDDYTREEIKGQRGWAVIEAFHAFGKDDSARDPDATTETFGVAADLPSVARAHMIIKDGKVTLADFRDDQDAANTVRGEITAEGFDNALLTIETAYQGLTTS